MSSTSPTIRRTASAVLATVLAALAAACSPAPPPASASTVTWGPCPAGVTGAELECATLDLPLDYREPDGETIEIAISRRAADPAARRGILLTNSGGPGGSGINFPAELKQLGLPQRVLDSYDVIGMDPRGVGLSTPVSCGLTPLEWITNIPLWARDAAAVEEQAATAAAVAGTCGSAPHLSTANTARDLDRVRAALGEPTASYFGISYGTYLGSVWATLFPATTDRVLLDSATGPGGWDAAFTRRLAEGFEDRFPDFAAYAVAHPELGLGTTEDEVRATYLDLGRRLDATPTAQGINGQVFRQVTFDRFYYDDKLPELAVAWQALKEDRPVPLPAPSSTAPAPGGPPSDNYLASQLHVVCNDSDWPEDIAVYQRNVAEDRVRRPLFGAAASNVTPCAFWSSEPAESPVRITDRGPSNVLIVHNRRDPATPLSGARELRAAFGDRARLITADQGGHLAYPFLDNACANDRATAFLLTGERPGEDLDCPR